MKYLQAIVIVAIASMSFLSCVRTEIVGPVSEIPFRYSDSIIYLKGGNTDHIEYPFSWNGGTYSAYPEGMVIDPKTGAINVSKSETGLRYLVKFQDVMGRVFITKVVLAGINYPDRFHNLAAGDSIARPVYNADMYRPLPAGNIFDDGSVANSAGLAVVNENGVINLAQTVKNGLFGTVPKSGLYVDVPVPYRINDKSENSLNSIKVRLYYYDRMSEVPNYLKQLLAEREKSYLSVLNSVDGNQVTLAKPRPPCVIIVGE